MDKELINRAWSVLPKEFKEEVKKVARIYSGRTSALFGRERHIANKFLDEFIGLFGFHNLTSDTETEEMLTIPRSVIIDRYHALTHPEDDYDSAQRRANIYLLQQLFGSKCLPDEVKPTESGRFEPKPAQSFKVGDKVIFPRNADEDLNGTIVHELPLEPAYIVVTEDGKGYTVFEHDLEPYTEPEEPTFTDNCQSQCKSQDHISDPTKLTADRRLNIAAMAMQGILSNKKLIVQPLSSKNKKDLAIEVISIADALIAELNKKKNENYL